MQFPIYRPRRLRANATLRNMVAETRLDVADLVYPLFVMHGRDVKEEIPPLPGNYRFSINRLVEECREIRDLGIPAVLLFGLPASKDENASEAYDREGIVQLAVQAIKNEVPDLLVITDVCLCEYTSHGHCGVIKDGRVDNDESLELLAKTALSHAEAGADIVAPSDMMDGRVSAIRALLDDSGYSDTPIMAYSAKYASGFYEPFRFAADSTPQFGDRKSYQMDPPNSNEAMREMIMDIEEGADIIMVKPAISYLDIIYRAKRELQYPLAAYNVSGEFAMIKAAVEKGWLDEKRIVMEMLTSIKRAGADIIITHWAKEAAGWLRSEI